MIHIIINIMIHLMTYLMTDIMTHIMINVMTAWKKVHSHSGQLSIFSEGLKPPTRYVLKLNLHILAFTMGLSSRI